MSRPPSPSAPAVWLAVGLIALTGCGEAGTPSADAPAPPTSPPRLETAADRRAAVAGATVYVPVYSHIFHQDGSREFDLTATLSVRNTDPDRTITVAEVGYYDSAGRLVRRYVDRPRRLGPLASESFVVEDGDRTGGVGANFLVEWYAETAGAAPIVEAVMISTAQSQGISLVSRGEVIRTLGEEATPPRQP